MRQRASTPQHTGGTIPLFIEEITKAVLEAENEGDARKTAAAVPSSVIAVPASLHASLMARLDRLGPAKEVAQIGAVIGREFSHYITKRLNGPMWMRMIFVRSSSLPIDVLPTSNLCVGAHAKIWTASQSMKSGKSSGNGSIASKKGSPPPDSRCEELQ